ncbi:hypothetical protein GQ602_004842 [Ophiocordyceps camponoti-floridani]|uniref:Uncharacterized protein n=1 Tax=Ophiocordyceps camponoti-floridani TaxID=2030778 RepID=A0A8H4Q4K9_9HYPO|nr:hypothetical protein GQ602_004842 [Ophiocordyceps camponoti-floridani]
MAAGYVSERHRAAHAGKKSSIGNLNGSRRMVRRELATGKKKKKKTRLERQGEQKQDEEVASNRQMQAVRDRRLLEAALAGHLSSA